MHSRTPSNDFNHALQSGLLTQAVDGILVIASDKLIHEATSRFFDIWGLAETSRPVCPSDDDLSGLCARLRPLTANPETFDRQMQSLASAPTPMASEAITLADGRTIACRASSLPGSDGQSLGRLILCREETPPGQQPEDANLRYRAAFHTTLDAIAISRLDDGTYIDVNQAFLDKSGYSRAELIGHTSLELGIWFDPDDRLKLQQQLRDGSNHARIETRFRTKSGDILWGIFSISRMEVEGAPCILSITRDITSEKLAQEELARHRHHLEQLVEARTAELSRAKEEAETASRAKSAFLANMSHEIRTPLNAITGMAYMIRRGGLTPTQSVQVDKLAAAGEHLLNIINAVLELSKIEAGKVTQAEIPIRIESVLDNVVSMLQGRADAMQLTLTVETGKLPRNLLGDPTSVQQAVLNYAANALKFTETGGLTLSAHLIEEDGEHALIRFEVRDTGIGIDPEALPRLFKAFEQADNSTTRKYGGTGLGLAITKRLAELMGGTVGASSQPGQGSTFWFSARFRKGREVKPLDEIEDDDIAGLLANQFASSRILLVEDEPINREIAVAMLEEAGLSVDVAEDGEQAVAAARKTPYDLILMDLQMPVMDGLQATRLIRAASGGGQVPIIAMTANAFADDKRRCLEAGMDDFLAKPVEPDMLFATVLHNLRRHTER